MTVAAFDGQGRRYLEVPPFAPGRLGTLAAAPETVTCADCGTQLLYGIDRYYQRSAGARPSLFDAWPPALTYDAVCGPCGDRALGPESLHVRGRVV